MWCYNGVMKTRIQNESDIQFGLDELVKRDPALSTLIETVENVPLRLSENGYAGLAKIVTSQLISRAAANAIWLRIENELGDVTAKNISCKTEQDLKDLGLSGAKARTFILLAKEVSNSTLNFDESDHLPPDKALKKLMSLKGIGRWSAEVYLMFCCGHADFFPAGDIALRTAAGNTFWHGVRPNEQLLRARSELWKPYRSIAARLLWAYYAHQENSDKNPI